MLTLWRAWLSWRACVLLSGLLHCRVHQPNELGLLGYLFRNCLHFIRAVFWSTIFTLTSINAVPVEVFEDFALLVGLLAISVIMMLLVDVVVEARAEEVLSLLTHLIRWRWISRRGGRGWQGHSWRNITRLAALMSAATSSTTSTPSTTSTSSTTSLLQPE